MNFLTSGRQNNLYSHPLTNKMSDNPSLFQVMICCNLLNVGVRTSPDPRLISTLSPHAQHLKLQSNTRQYRSIIFYVTNILYFLTLVSLYGITPCNSMLSMILLNLSGTKKCCKKILIFIRLFMHYQSYRKHEALTITISIQTV